MNITQKIILEEKYPFLSLLPLIEKTQHEQAMPASQGALLKLLDTCPKLTLIAGVDIDETSSSLESWLDKDSTRRLLFFEKRVSILSQLFQEQKYAPLLAHPQVFVYFLEEKINLLDAFLEQVRSYPADTLQMFLTPYYQAREDEHQLKIDLFRQASLITALFHEKAWYHHLCDNLFSNFLMLPKAFYADHLQGAFSSFPAIICGAGPSLQTQAQLLKQCQDRALILAGGSTLSALERLGVTPHLGFALDPNPEEFERLHGAFGNTYPLLFGARLEKRCSKKWKGSLGYMKTSSGGFLEQELQLRLELNQEPILKGLTEDALSVTTMALSAAVSMGCHPIYLVGVDLAYVDHKRYSSGVVSDQQNCEDPSDQVRGCIDEPMQVFNRAGDLVTTTVKWKMEQAAIETFALSHPDVLFVDCIEKGLGFPALKQGSLKELLACPIAKMQPRVAKAIASCDLCCKDPDTIFGFLHELRQTLGACGDLLNSFLELFFLQKNPEETALGTLHLMDLQSQQGYQWLLQPLEEHAEALFTTPLDKWRYYQELVKNYLGKLEQALQEIDVLASGHHDHLGHYKSLEVARDD